jgi:formylmethanofuran dehydrogenase subunit A
VVVSLAPDWSMGGSQNMLDELRFADDWDNKHFNNKLTPKDLVVMSTKNPAALLALSTKIGEVKVGLVADLFVVSGDPTKPYDAILGATPKTVAMVMIGGKVVYGDASIKAAGPAVPGCETIDICTKQKFVCVATTSMSATDKFAQTYTDIKAALEKGLTDSDAVTMGDGFNFAPLAPIVKCK